MDAQNRIPEDQLAGALRALGVDFLAEGGSGGEALARDPARLIAALAAAREARLRLALIPLFLARPELAPFAAQAAAAAGARAGVTLRCYYTAAHFLQREMTGSPKRAFGTILPDLFSRELRLSEFADPESGLRLLAERQRELTDEDVNWLGTYRHAAEIWLRAREPAHA